MEAHITVLRGQINYRNYGSGGESTLLTLHFEALDMWLNINGVLNFAVHRIASNQIKNHIQIR